MFTRVGLASAIVAIVAATAPLNAQRGLRPLEPSSTGVIQFTPYVGYMAYGDFFRGPAGTSLSTRNDAVYGAQVAFAIVPNVALYGNAAYSRTDLQIGVPFVGGVDAGNANVWLFDGGLQFTAPAGRFNENPIRPFLQVGAGAMRYDIDAANVLNTSSTNFAWNAGVGIDARLARSVGLRLMAKDYVGRFNFRDATGVDVRGPVTQNWAFTAGLRIGF